MSFNGDLIRYFLFAINKKHIGNKYIGKIKNTLSNIKTEVSSVTNEIDIDETFNQKDIKKESKKKDE